MHVCTYTHAHIHMRVVGVVWLLFQLQTVKMLQCPIGHCSNSSHSTQPTVHSVHAAYNDNYNYKLNARCCSDWAVVLVAEEGTKGGGGKYGLSAAITSGWHEHNERETEP